MASKLCVWHQDYDIGCWNSGCGKVFEITQGTPTENGMRFCCYCGKPLKEKSSLESELIQAAEEFIDSVAGPLKEKGAK